VAPHLAGGVAGPLAQRWVETSAFDGEPIPLERHRKVKGELTLLCQMLAGWATSAAAFLVGEVPDLDASSSFLRWFHEWTGEYLEYKGLSFEAVRESKRLRLGMPDLVVT
jgi:hypothetical protein